MKHEACLNIQALTDFLYKQYNGAPKGIIFDCDGVLVDSVEANMKYYNMMRTQLGLPDLNEEQRDYCQMSTVMQAFDYIIPKNLHSEIPKILKTFSYSRDITPLIVASEKVVTLLQRFKPYLRLGVHTNRMNSIDDMINGLGMEGLLDPIITVQHAEPKPSPDGTFKVLRAWNLEAHEVLFIGDSLADRDAANAAKVPFISYRNPKLEHKGTCCDFDELSEAIALLLDID